MDDRDWEGVSPLLHDEFVREWPQSRERIRGRDNFVAVNRNYPGDWSITVDQVLVDGERAASHVTVHIDGRNEVAVSFYELRDGLIRRQIEYWPEPYSAPTWRAAWVEITGTDDSATVNGSPWRTPAGHRWSTA
jgi:hypothetical protein